MSRKRIAMICTRFTNRPVHKEFIRNLMKLDWNNSCADLYVYWHGDKPAGAALSADFHAMENSPQVKGVRYTYGTENKFPPMTKFILDDFACGHNWKERKGEWDIWNQGYEFIGLMDDDCYYLDPVASMARICECFDLTKQIAAVGPTGSFRFYKKYKLAGRVDELFNQFPGPPWATLGSQVYRISALRQCNLDFLDKLKFRMDVPLFLLLHGMGYMVGETNTPFNHVVSGGLNAKTVSSDFFNTRLRQAEADYRIMWEALEPQIDTEQKDYVHKELLRCMENELRHTRKRLIAFQQEFLHGPRTESGK